jgi:putative flippase GtrA
MNLRRFARFNAVGGLGIGVQLAAIWALTDVAALPYLAATVIAVSTAVVHNFVWHLRWTWGDRPVTPAGMAAAFVGFVSANGLVSLTGNVVIMTALTGGAGLTPVVANAIAIATCGLVNFWLGDQVVFKAGVSPESRVLSPGSSRYSSRRARSGSTFAARRAGTRPASTPMTTSASAEPASVTGSRGDKPYSSVAV